MTDNKTLKQEDLDQFTGSENWYAYKLLGASFGSYTDGVKYMAETAGAYWLIDEVMTAQMLPKVRRQEFQVWKLTKNKTGHGARLVMEDGNYNKVYSKTIAFTDFPLPEIELFFENKVLYLPSER